MTPLELQLDIIKRNCQIMNKEHQQIYQQVQEAIDAVHYDL